MLNATDKTIIEFLSTPSGWRATSYHTFCKNQDKFLSTPSGWRATRYADRAGERSGISIHALRVEGDGCRRSKTDKSCYFYPRPPGGGRRRWRTSLWMRCNFYPRPPGGGRLVVLVPFIVALYNFYPRPPGGGRHSKYLRKPPRRRISIHALRVEGDPRSQARSGWLQDFYPRPPGGGRRDQRSDDGKV